MKNLLTFESVASAIAVVLGLALLYGAATGENHHLAWAVYLYVGWALGAFAIAAQPQALLEKVERRGFKILLPRARGWAGLLNLASCACLVLAALLWLLS